MSAKAFVLMSKKTGYLMEGYRISLFDQDFAHELDNAIRVSFMTHDGWILFSPEAGPVPFFLNLKGEEFFEVLGPL